MQITASSLQDFDEKLSASQWNPPAKSNSFHTIQNINVIGSINLYTDTIPKINSKNLLVNDKNELVYVGEGDNRYYGYYNADDDMYYKAYIDNTGKITITSDILSYPNNKDLIFINVGLVNVYGLLTHSGTIHTGVFTINGNGKYRSLIVIADTELVLDNSVTISDTEISIHGRLNIQSGSSLVIENNSRVIIYSDAILDVPNDVDIFIEDGSMLEIYGTVNISQDYMGLIMNNPKIYIDTAAVLNVTDIPYSDREYSLTDYESDLRETRINIYNQGQHHSGIADIGYRWKAGTPANKSQVIDMEVLWGEAILGDYKLSVLGTQQTEMENRQFISRLIIYNNTILNISESFQDGIYYEPELYLGVTIGNTKSAGMCINYGSIIVDGSNSKITIDRKAYLYIGESGSVSLTNGAKILSANNEKSIVLQIDGTLTIDSLDQLQGFEPDNIAFGTNGKLIILNPASETRNLLWTTPNGIKQSELYRLFVSDTETYDEEKHELVYSRLRHIEYHINANSGIGLDTKYDNYSVQMNRWYNGMRLERAIKEGLIIWHSGAFIEFYHSVDPNINIQCNLYDAANFFKHYGSNKEEYLQDVVNHFVYAGAGNIVFRFYGTNNRYAEVVMNLEGIHITSASHIPGEDDYNITVDNSGMIFLRNRVGSISTDTIVQGDSIHHALSQGNNTITIK